MVRQGRRSFTDRVVVWAFILGGHVLLIMIFMSGKRLAQQVSTDAPSPGVLLLLELPQDPSTSGPEPEAQLASLPLIAPPPLPTPEIDSESTAITLPPEVEERPGTNAIDWGLEAERSARAVVEEDARSREKRIGEHPPSPFGEKKKPREFDWDPHPSRVGVARGLIPYVRVTQRCVVGLGFFGCRLGKLPEANGRLFDGMHDPDRQRSSVPEVDTSSALDPPQD